MESEQSLKMIFFGLLLIIIRVSSGPFETTH